MISVLGAEKLSLVEIEAFLQVSEHVRLTGQGRADINGWIERLLCQYVHEFQKWRARGVRAYKLCCALT